MLVDSNPDKPKVHVDKDNNAVLEIFIIIYVVVLFVYLLSLYWN